MLFTFILFMSPQQHFPFLQAFSLGKLSAGLAIATYLLERLHSRRGFTVRVPAVWLVLSLLVLGIVSIPFSGWPGGSLDALLNDLVKSAIIFLLVANTLTTVRRMKLMIGSMGLWGCIMAWMAFKDYTAGNLATAGVRIRGYESPLTADPNDLALTLNLILALLMGLYLAADKLHTRLLLLGVMGVLVIGVIMSFSRGGFLTLVAVGAVFVVHQVRHRGVPALVPILVLVFLALLFLPPGYGDRVYTIFDTSADPTGSAGLRRSIMIEGLQLMLENPLVGLGIGMHGLVFPERGFGWQGIHSAFIQVGADLGVMGFVIYLLLMWQIFKVSRQSRIQLTGSSKDREVFGLGAGIEFALVGYCVGGGLLPVAYRFYVYYIAGFAVALYEIAKRRRSTVDLGDAEPIESAMPVGDR